MRFEFWLMILDPPAVSMNDISGIFRGLALWEAFEKYSGWGRSPLSVVILPSRKTDGVCYNLVDEVGIQSLLARSISVIPDHWLHFNSSDNCMMSNDTCLYSLGSTINSCDEVGDSITLPDEIFQHYIITESIVRCSFLLDAGQVEAAAQELESLRTRFMELAAMMSVPLTMFARPMNCDISLPLNFPELAGLAEIGLAYALINLYETFLEWRCSITGTLIEPQLRLSLISNSCDRDGLGVATGYLLSERGFTLPPITLDMCEKAGDADSSSRYTFISVVDGFLVISGEDIYSISSTGLFVNSTENLTPNCSVTFTQVTECEEIPSYLCDSFDGCFVAWGPCQAVSVGFFSPKGTTAQIPCPVLPENQVFVAGDSSTACTKACRELDQVIQEGRCVTPPPGFIPIASCNQTLELIQCSEIPADGWIFESPGFCTARPVAVALGDFIPISQMEFTVETWVRLNSVPLSRDSSESFLPIYGIFGSIIIGFRSLNETSIALVLFVLLEDGWAQVSSGPISHLSRSRWAHIAAVVDSGVTSFFFNGVTVGSSSIGRPAQMKSAPLQISSFLVNFASAQIFGYIHREHLGPFRLLPGDLAVIDGASNPWNIYLTSVFMEFDVFKPTTRSKAAKQIELEFYKSAPEGVREKTSVQYSSLYTNTTCKHFCLARPSICGADCDDGIWDPFVCECYPRSVVCSSSPPWTTRIPSSIAATSSQQPAENSSSTNTSIEISRLCTSWTTTRLDPVTIAENGNWVDSLVAVILLFCVLVGFLLCIKRRRRASRISSVETAIHPLPPYAFPNLDWLEY
jgi:hypothetical protein